MQPDRRWLYLLTAAQKAEEAAQVAPEDWGVSLQKMVEHIRNLGNSLDRLLRRDSCPPGFMHSCTEMLRKQIAIIAWRSTGIPFDTHLRALTLASASPRYILRVPADVEAFYQSMPVWAYLNALSATINEIQRVFPSSLVLQKIKAHGDLVIAMSNATSNAQHGPGHLMNVLLQNDSLNDMPYVNIHASPLPPPFTSNPSSNRWIPPRHASALPT